MCVETAWRRTVVRGLVATTMLVAAVAVVHTARQSWLPVSDDAAMWFRACDVGGRHTPLFGPFSRMGWHHPGPVMFYVFALPVRLLGGSPTGILVATLLVSLSSAVVLVLLTARR